MISVIRENKALLHNIVYNTLGSIILVVMYQVFVYPEINRISGTSFYGVFLTTIGLVNVLTTVFGQSLNNTNVVTQNLKTRNRRTLRTLFYISIITSSILLIIMLLLYNLTSGYYILVLIFLLMLMINRVVQTSIFRINLDFKGYFLMNCVQLIGVIIGFVLYHVLREWIIIFILGEVFSFMFLVTNKNINMTLRSNDDSPLNPIMIRKYFSLLIVTLLGNLMNYLDRFMILPLLGSIAVSTYYTSAFFAKGVSAVVLPLSGIVLSYISKKDSIDKKIFSKSLLIIVVIGMLFFTMSAIFSRVFIHYLYPDLEMLAMQVYIYSSLSITLMIMGSMLNPFIVRFSKNYVMIGINLFVICIYLILGYLFSKSNGIIGFGTASVIVYFIRFIMISYFGYRSCQNSFGEEEVEQ